TLCSTRLASVATVSLFGPTTTAVAPQPALETAPSTWASNEWPAILCNTFGRAERMRVPSPAASTMARQVRSLTKAALRGAPGARRPHIRVRRNGKGGMRAQAFGKHLAGLGQQRCGIVSLASTLEERPAPRPYPAAGGQLGRKRAA